MQDGVNTRQHGNSRSLYKYQNQKRTQRAFTSNHDKHTTKKDTDKPKP